MMKTRSQLLHQFTGPSAFWRTLRFQFALWVAVLLFVTQIALGAYIYLALEDRLLDAIDDTLRLNAAQITGLIELQEGQIILAEAERDRPLSEELEEHSLTARILDPSGNVVQAYGIYRNVSVPQQSRGLGRQSRERLLTIPDPLDDDSLVLVFTTPIQRQGQVIGTLEVMQSLDSIEEALEQLLTLLELGLLLSVPAAAIGGYGLASRALGRVDRITAMARGTSARDLSARLNFPRTNDEVGRLAQTFDMMLGRLETAFKHERQFTSDASHELRTPLAVMRTVLETTRTKRRSPEEYERALDDLTEETERLQNLVSELLRLARSEARDEAGYQAVNLSALLQDISDSLRPLAESRPLTLICDVPDGLTLVGNRDDLIRLFSNLLYNAINYTDQGEIRIKAEVRSKDWLTVTITDTGRGIPAEHLPHIFDRFYRVETSRTSAGTGLGLTIALSIAQAHGGTIDVDSKVGQGSRFRVHLQNIPPKR